MRTNMIAMGAALALAGTLAGKSAGAGQLELTLRSRSGGEGNSPVERKRVTWDAKKTAVIVCDMWDTHWCKGATARTAELAPHVDALLRKARSRGALIIHAPSGTVGQYAGHPARKVALAARAKGPLPENIDRWCKQIHSEKGAVWPIDDSDGGCDCTPKCKQGNPWRKQIASIAIPPGDAISDSGVEIWQLLEERGIENVLLLGVHANMCVLGRPFGLRNLVRCGKNVALVRDLTDTMYCSRMAPFVSHFRGTDLIVDYIERYVCPTVSSTSIMGGEPFRFADDRRPRVALAIAEREYKTWETVPAFAETVLGNKLGFALTEVYGKPEKDRNSIPGFAEAVAQADLVFLSIRRRALPTTDLAALRRHLEEGKPLMGIRTCSHAFDTKGKHPEGHAEWPAFDAEVLGGHYTGHHGNGPATIVTIAPRAEKHPILRGVKAPFTSKGSLYKSSPLTKTAVPLLMGSIEGKPPEPVAWVNTYKNARIFYTSLGYPDDFSGTNAPVPRLLENAALWLTQGIRPSASGVSP